MKLFNKEKDFILKITNLVLLLWLVASIVLLFNATIDLLMPKSIMTYKEYKDSNCYYYALPEDTKESSDTYCKSAYDSYKTQIKDGKYQTKRNIFNFIGSTIIVSGALYFLNKKKINKVKEDK